MLLTLGVDLDKSWLAWFAGYKPGEKIMWVVFVVMLTVWLVVLIASGFGGLIHSLVVLCKPDVQPVALSPTDQTPGTGVRY